MNKVPGEIKWLGYLTAYLIKAEFLGYSYHDPSDDEHWESRPTRYYRALSSVETSYYDNIKPGHILEEYGKEDEAFDSDKDKVIAEIKANREYWIRRQEADLNKKKKELYG